MTKKIVGVLSTGPSGNGKTTFFELLETLLKSKHSPKAVGRIDMSKILTRWGMTRNGPLGDKLRENAYLIDIGKLLPDDLVIETFNAWHEDLLIGPDSVNIKVLLLSGAPRSIPQLCFLDVFDKSLVINIQATRQQSDAAIKERLKHRGSELRSDDAGGHEVFEQKWAEYEQSVLPAMDKLNGNGLHLNRDQPLTDRLRNTLQHMKTIGGPLDAHLIEKALRRLEASNHPIHHAIRKIENPETVTA